MSIKFGSWDENIHTDYEQVQRIESGRKLSKNIVEIDKQNGWAKIQGSSPDPYFTTLNECTCIDFNRRRLPCKHIYCLAFELGEMNDLPKYHKRKSAFNVAEEIERYKSLYLNGEISADTYVKICTALAKSK